jgi:hypothetical protein
VNGLLKGQARQNGVVRLEKIQKPVSLGSDLTKSFLGRRKSSAGTIPNLPLSLLLLLLLGSQPEQEQEQEQEENLDLRLRVSQAWMFCRKTA